MFCSSIMHHYYMSVCTVGGYSASCAASSYPDIGALVSKLFLSKLGLVLVHIQYTYYILPGAKMSETYHFFVAFFFTFFLDYRCFF